MHAQTNSKTRTGGRASSARLHRLCGYVYAVTGVLKGVTACMLAYGNPKAFPLRVAACMFTYGAWDVCSVAVAVWAIAVQRDVDRHRQWMVRNFAIGDQFDDDTQFLPRQLLRSNKLQR